MKKTNGIYRNCWSSQYIYIFTILEFIIHMFKYIFCAFFYNPVLNKQNEENKNANLKVFPNNIIILLYKISSIYHYCEMIIFGMNFHF